MPLPARPSMAPASARKVGSVVTALCPARLELGASVAMPAASVPMRQPAVPRLEPVPVPLGGMGPTASSPARRGSLVKAVPVAVTVTMLTAAILFTDTASARLGGQVPAATSPALRASGEPTAATLVPAGTGAPASPRMATASVHPDSEALSARNPVSLAATANAVCPASVPTIPPVTLRMGPATAWLAGPALTALNHALWDTGEPTVPSSASVAMVGPATPRMGAVSVPQAGPDISAWKAVLQGCLVPTAPNRASVVLERGATQRLGPVCVLQGTVVPPAGSEARSRSP